MLSIAAASAAPRSGDGAAYPDGGAALPAVHSDRRRACDLAARGMGAGQLFCILLRKGEGREVGGSREGERRFLPTMKVGESQVSERSRNAHEGAEEGEM